MKTIFLVTDQTDFENAPVAAFESETNAFELVMALHEELAYENFCYYSIYGSEERAWENYRRSKRRRKYPFFVIHKIVLEE